MVWKPHTTVAAVIEHEDQFLMVTERIDNALVINQPAGHLNENESLLQAVIREVQEETAWQFQPAGIVGIYRWQHPNKNKTYIRTTFFGSVSNHNSQQPLDHPIVKADWLTRQQLELQNLRSPMVMRCIDDYSSGNQFPLEMLGDV